MASELSRRVAQYGLPYFAVARVQMIFRANEGSDNDEIASRLDTRREVANQWRNRFFKERLASVEEGARRGRLRAFSLIGQG